MKSKVTINMGHETKLMQFSDLESGDIFVPVNDPFLLYRKVPQADRGFTAVNLDVYSPIWHCTDQSFSSGVRRVDIEIKVFRK